MQLSWLIAVIGFLLVLYVVAQYGLRLLYSYRLTPDSLEILLFRALPVYRLPFKEIESAYTASWSEAKLGFSALRLGNRFARRYVVIKKKGGLLRVLVITPVKADEFAKQISANCSPT